LLGKNLGDDLREGKTTLPLIFAMQRCNEHDKQVIKSAIELGDAPDITPILNIIVNTGAMQATKAVAHEQATLAIQALDPLPNSSYKEALIELASQLLIRSN